MGEVGGVGEAGRRGLPADDRRAGQWKCVGPAWLPSLRRRRRWHRRANRRKPQWRRASDYADSYKEDEGGEEDVGEPQVAKISPVDAVDDSGPLSRHDRKNTSKARELKASEVTICIAYQQVIGDIRFSEDGLCRAFHREGNAIRYQNSTCRLEVISKVSRAAQMLRLCRLYGHAEDIIKSRATAAPRDPINDRPQQAAAQILGDKAPAASSRRARTPSSTGPSEVAHHLSSGSLGFVEVVRAPQQHIRGNSGRSRLATPRRRPLAASTTGSVLTAAQQQQKQSQQQSSKRRKDRHPSAGRRLVAKALPTADSFPRCRSGHELVGGFRRQRSKHAASVALRRSSRPGTSPTRRRWCAGDFCGQDRRGERLQLSAQALLHMSSDLTGTDDEPTWWLQGV